MMGLPGQGGGDFWQRIMAARQGGQPGGAQRRPAGPAMGAGMMGAMGGARPPSAGGFAPRTVAPQMGMPAAGMMGMAGMPRQPSTTPGMRPMGMGASSMMGMGGGGPPAKAPLPTGGAMNRPAIANSIGGLSMMSDERGKQNVTRAEGLRDRYAALGGDDAEQDDRKKRMGLEMFQSGMSRLGR